MRPLDDEVDDRAGQKVQPIGKVRSGSPEHSEQDQHANADGEERPAFGRVTVPAEVLVVKLGQIDGQAGPGNVRLTGVRAHLHLHRLAAWPEPSAVVAPIARYNVRDEPDGD